MPHWNLSTPCNIPIDLVKQYLERKDVLHVRLGCLRFRPHNGCQFPLRVRTVIWRLNWVQLRARRPIKCPYVTLRHRREHLKWGWDGMRWDIPIVVMMKAIFCSNQSITECLYGENGTMTMSRQERFCYFILRRWWNMESFEIYCTTLTTPSLTTLSRLHPSGDRCSSFWQSFVCKYHLFVRTTTLDRIAHIICMHIWTRKHFIEIEFLGRLYLNTWVQSRMEGIFEVLK